MTLESSFSQQWSRFACEWTAQPPLIPARVASQHRGRLLVHTETGSTLAMLRGSLLDNPPVVGDWVVLRLLDGAAIIEDRLERKTVLERRAGGGAIQLIAANVDCVGVVCAVDDDFNPRRIDRFLAVARGGGCEARIVLSKADKVADLAPHLAALAEEPLIVSSHEGRGIDAVRSWIGGRTAAFLGTSGAGKSSLINALMGEDVRVVKQVAADGRGQHTTTSRDLLLLPTGGCVVDTPGMREVGLTSTADASEAFPDIVRLESTCTYRNCRHTDEPGCAVMAAITAGEMPADRLRNYHKLLRELQYQARRENKHAQRTARKKFGQMVKDIQRLKSERGY